MRDQHDVHLKLTTAVTLLSKVLQHLRIADRGIGNIGLKKL